MFQYQDYEQTGGKLTAKEILQQPVMWRETMRVLEANLPRIRAFMGKIAAQPGLRALFTGAGSSGFCGEMVSAAVNQYLGMNTDAPHTTDLVGAPDTVLSPETPTLLVSFARSGNSPESVAAVKYARKKVKVLYELAITCAEGGTLNRITAGRENALSLVLPPATCDEAFAMTSSVTSMVLCAFGVFAYEAFADYQANVLLAAEGVEETFAALCDCAYRIVAEKDFRRAVYLGSGVLKGCAHEGALKMCELSQGEVDVMSHSALAFRHGPKSAVNADTISLHLISTDPLTRQYDRDLLQEILEQREGNRVVVISAQEIGLPVADDSVFCEKAAGNDLLLAVTGLVFLQLLSFFKSQSLGVNTDDPSPGGQVSRVVSGVKVYEV